MAGDSGNSDGGCNRDEEVQIQIADSSKAATLSTHEVPIQNSPVKSWQWWLMVGVNMFFLIAGQTASTLLGRFYYNQGGNSKWMSTFVQTAGFPLAFNAVFSYFLNAQKFTPLIFNSVVLLTFSASLLGVDEDSQGITSISHGKYILGFLLTLGASATYSLILSLMQVTFEKVIKRETFSVVLNMQIYTALVATLASLVGLFASGEWMTLQGEMHAFQSGKLSYVMTLLWTAISWQVASVGVVGLIFVVSSLFSNVISTLALPIIPVFAVIFFHDKMDGVKIIAMLMAIWGFMSYGHQLYVDGKKGRKTTVSVEETS
uniref:Probable purine permease n=1 Tax=Oryza nivara TaxID=4536 RepID=A0A0E0G5Z5_ORYNI